MEYAKKLRLGGYDDWRLPTLEEIGSVADFYTAESKGFILHCNYWTSTTFLHDFVDCIGGAWVRDFGYAKDRDSLSHINCVRCVRKDNKF